MRPDGCGEHRQKHLRVHLLPKGKDFSIQVTKIYQVNIPYAAKQLLQELMAMHIVPKLYFASKKNYI